MISVISELTSGILIGTRDTDQASTTLVFSVTLCKHTSHGGYAMTIRNIDKYTIQCNLSARDWPKLQESVTSHWKGLHITYNYKKTDR